jgi:hypothetical protein
VRDPSQRKTVQAQKEINRLKGKVRTLNREVGSLRVKLATAEQVNQLHVANTAQYRDGAAPGTTSGERVESSDVAAGAPTTQAVSGSVKSSALPTNDPAAALADSESDSDDADGARHGQSYADQLASPSSSHAASRIQSARRASTASRGSRRHSRSQQFTIEQIEGDTSLFPGERQIYDDSLEAASSVEDLTGSPSAKELPVFGGMSAVDLHEQGLQVLIREIGREGNVRQALKLALKLRQLLTISTKIAEATDLDNTLMTMVNLMCKLLQCDRASVFVVDHVRQELWSTAKGVARFRIPINTGIAGYVARTGESCHIPDCYNDPRFNQSMDKKTGYRTKNLLCMAATRKGRVEAVLQVINKRTTPHFTNVDEVMLGLMSNMVGIVIANKGKKEAQAAALETKTALLGMGRLLGPSVLPRLDGPFDIDRFAAITENFAKDLLQVGTAKLYFLERPYKPSVRTLMMAKKRKTVAPPPEVPRVWWMKTLLDKDVEAYRTREWVPATGLVGAVVRRGGDAVEGFNAGELAAEHNASIDIVAPALYVVPITNFRGEMLAVLEVVKPTEIANAFNGDKPPTMSLRNADQAIAAKLHSLAAQVAGTLDLAMLVQKERHESIGDSSGYLAEVFDRWYTHLMTHVASARQVMRSAVERLETLRKTTVHKHLSSNSVRTALSIAKKAKVAVQAAAKAIMTPAGQPDLSSYALEFPNASADVQVALRDAETRGAQVDAAFIAAIAEQSVESASASLFVGSTTDTGSQHKAHSTDAARTAAARFSLAVHGFVLQAMLLESACDRLKQAMDEEIASAVPAQEERTDPQCQPTPGEPCSTAPEDAQVTTTDEASAPVAAHVPSMTSKMADDTAESVAASHAAVVDGAQEASEGAGEEDASAVDGSDADEAVAGFFARKADLHAGQHMDVTASHMTKQEAASAAGVSLGQHGLQQDLGMQGRVYKGSGPAIAGKVAAPKISHAPPGAAPPPAEAGQ